MTASEYFATLFGYLDTIFSMSFSVFGFDITLWGLFLAGCICTFLFRILFAYIFG